MFHQWFRGMEIAQLSPGQHTSSYCGIFFCCHMGGQLSTELWPDLSPGNGLLEHAAKNVEELATVCAQLPKAACHASLCITPGFDEYSQYENTYLELRRALLRMWTHSSLVWEIRWLGACTVFCVWSSCVCRTLELWRCFHIWARRWSLSCKQRVTLLRTIGEVALALLSLQARTKAFLRWSGHPVWGAPTQVLWASSAFGSVGALDPTAP